MGNCILHIETFRLQRCFDDEHEEYVKTKKKEILDEKIAEAQRNKGMLCLHLQKSCFWPVKTLRSCLRFLFCLSSRATKEVVGTK